METSRRAFLLSAVAAGGGFVLFGSRRTPAGIGSPPEAATPGADIALSEFSPDGRKSGTITVQKLQKTDKQWKRQLSVLEYDILRKFDDEIPGTGLYNKNHEAGIYRCIACDTAVFGSSHKFDTNTGWPSFYKPLAAENVTLRKDARAVRVLCSRCEGFLGDLFDDGPAPTGMRYCINSAALRFVPANAAAKETAVLAGGCFWGVDAVFKHVRGVISVASGYAGGDSRTAQYERIENGDTGHAESVEITFDPRVISYDALLRIFFLVAHDPTQLNRQGPDTGTQYRSAIFPLDDAQKKAAELAIKRLDQAEVYPKDAVTTIEMGKKFYRAEDYHQNYLALHPTQPYIVYNDLPKLDALRREFPERYQEPSASR